MKANNPIRVVLVDEDSTRRIRARSRAFETFTTVHIEDRKNAIATKYVAFWSLISRKIV